MIDTVKKNALILQDSLAKLNLSQACIFATGLAINLIMSAWGVFNGTMTAGDFVLLETYFL